MEKGPGFLSAVLLNGRMRYYRRYLEHAISQGYAFRTLQAFFSAPAASHTILLRHDVDKRDVGVRQMLDIERELGISSSWYFRWGTANRTLMNTLIESGSEVGLHYETLTALCEKRGINDRERVTAAVMEEARRLLIEEVARFRKTYDVPCRTIAAHGHPLRKKIGVSNSEITTPGLYSKAGVEVEAYDSRLLSLVDCYVSDHSLLVNRGWAYRISLVDAIAQGHSRICFLSHPSHWWFPLRRRVQLLAQLCKHGATEDDRTFAHCLRKDSHER